MRLFTVVQNWTRTPRGGRLDRVLAGPILHTPRSPLLGSKRAFSTAMPSTQIILNDNIAGLGAEADVVKVRRGYARNFLLPQGKAFEVTPATMRQLDNLKAKRAEREARELNDAEELSRRIGKLKVTFTLETGETGKAFGSITAQDLVTRIKNELGNEIDRHRLVLERPIKESGDHEVPIKLHAEVTAKFKFSVKASEAPKVEPPPDVDAPTFKSRGPRKRSDKR